ncbi:MAG: sigma-70 family RNA polymerase sigma factor [Clostridia bacterium]|nr:sigma-70 family RNA polymerase sigma factor [Clostridia bacterium]
MDNKEYSNDSGLSLEETVEKYYDAIWRNALFLVRFSEEDAYDITQNVFLLLAQKWDELDKRHIGAWLFEVSRRKIIDFFRAEEKQRGGKQVISFDDPSSVFPDLATYDEYFQVDPELLEKAKDEILSSLTEEERSLYNDLFENGRSYNDIVNLYSVSYTDVSTKAKRLRDKIKKQVVLKADALDLSGLAYLFFTIRLLLILLYKEDL